jgi:hypothetical protein
MAKKKRRLGERDSRGATVELRLDPGTITNRHKAARIVKNVASNYPDCRVTMERGHYAGTTLITAKCLTDRQEAKVIDRATSAIFKAKKRGVLSGRRRK